MLLDFFRKKKPQTNHDSPSDTESCVEDKKFLKSSEIDAVQKSRSKEDISCQNTEEKPMFWLQKMVKGLTSTSVKLKEGIAEIISKKRIDDSVREELEDLLIRSDIGVEVAQRIVNNLIAKRYKRDVSLQCILQDMSAQIHEILSQVSSRFDLNFSHKPHVILVVGVNGVGKTTAIGKLSKKISDSGFKVLLAAGDTFRSAASDQLKIWANRSNADFVGSKIGADAAALAYESFQQAQMKNIDVLIIDTAGRLQNNVALMAEIGKMIRVLKRLDPDSPHSVLQVLDATVGQNALRQVEMFHVVAGVTGLIMAKLDGTARGGSLISISIKHQLPIYFIGTGEGIDDLEHFAAKDFTAAITGFPDFHEEQL
ncbi:MAG: signal recognition particle-docking protein FtsY [Candidatus Liberibacter ctenarytainae]|uniref:Signal recognition particle receptor FtsY n=1 Tax=Candidatus Liberibacter ctenarytainae TaxID=2020335 RepID=A0A937AE26_9HYPH|nr:signal recognition particle-docking protein FtsY [Candidatus Liberibacter ctenarytainae]